MTILATVAAVFALALAAFCAGVGYALEHPFDAGASYASLPRAVMAYKLAGVLAAVAGLLGAGYVVSR